VEARERARGEGFGRAREEDESSRDIGSERTQFLQKPVSIEGGQIGSAEREVEPTRRAQRPEGSRAIPHALDAAEAIQGSAKGFGEGIVVIGHEEAHAGLQLEVTGPSAHRDDSRGGAVLLRPP
jgi:hypothetical protein